MAATAQHDVDHYEVLRLPSGEEGEALSVDQIEKAYRAQALLRHPDKRRHDPAATADFQALRRSYKLLSDDSLRREFDARLRARRQATAHAADRAAATGVKRRKAVSDLEERERAFAARGGSSTVDPAELASREDKLRSADLKRELDEFFDARGNFIAASTTAHGDNKAGTPDNGTKTDKGKVLKVSWKGGADYYNAAKLVEIFSQLGEVEDVVIMTSKSNRKGSSIVVMASKEAARTALKNHFVYNVFPVPLMVAPVEDSGGSPALATPTSEPWASNTHGTGLSDMEASVFQKLQKAQKRKQCG